MVAAHDVVKLGSSYDELEAAHDIVEAVVAVQDKLDAAHDAVELVFAHDAVGHVLGAVDHVLSDW